MDNRERIELKIRIRNLKELMNHMIQIEEYGLCSQLTKMISDRERELKEYESKGEVNR